MDVFDDRHAPMRAVIQIRHGECFEHDGKIYMRLQTIQGYKKDKKVPVVIFEDGKVSFLIETTKVVEVCSDLRITGDC